MGLITFDPTSYAFSIEFATLPEIVPEVIKQGVSQVSSALKNTFGELDGIPIGSEIKATPKVKEAYENEMNIDGTVGTTYNPDISGSIEIPFDKTNSIVYDTLLNLRNIIDGMGAAVPRTFVHVPFTLKMTERSTKIDHFILYGCRLQRDEVGNTKNGVISIAYTKQSVAGPYGIKLLNASKLIF